MVLGQHPIDRVPDEVHEANLWQGVNDPLGHPCDVRYTKYSVDASPIATASLDPLKIAWYHASPRSRLLAKKAGSFVLG